ncbi:MAG TPA: hypothetical protein PKW33_05800 [Anaerolineaceae bacterium]|nr:hypothetical protein [Anaerolineaceae bacterium]HPN51081.1 hypothetical protein [Anaerolineaceae bacterium]
MNLIEDYLLAVGQRLPEKQRDDIVKEIRSTLEDMLEEKRTSPNQDLDEETIVEILRKMGPPQKVAAGYLPPRYLIGPELYPAFITTLRIVLAVLLVLLVMAAGVGLSANATSAAGLAQVVGEGIMNLFDASLHALGIVVFIFVMIQWFSPDFRPQQKETDWDPRKLKVDSNEERVKPFEPILGILLNTAAIVALNVYHPWIGISSLENGHWVHASILTPAFFTYLPWITILWTAESAVLAFVMARSRWTRNLTLASIGIELAGVFLLGAMLIGPAITALDVDALIKINASTSAASLEQASLALNNGVRIGLGLVMAFSLFEIGKKLYRLFLKGRTPLDQA